MEYAQRIALDTFMTEYADDLDFETNLQKLVNSGEADSDMVVAEQYQYVDLVYLSGEIEDLASRIQKAMDSVAL